MNLPPYKNFPVIAGDRISLRQIQTDDVKGLVEISFYDSVQAITLQQAKEMQSMINKDYEEGKSIHWGIADNSNNKIVGTCGYYRGFDDWTGELGCVLLPKYRGQGYMTSAMLSAIDFGINTIGLKRVRAITTQQNTKAVRLLERLRFVRMADHENDKIEFEFRMNE